MSTQPNPEDSRAIIVAFASDADPDAYPGLHGIPPSPRGASRRVQKSLCGLWIETPALVSVHDADGYDSCPGCWEAAARIARDRHTQRPHPGENP